MEVPFHPDESTQLYNSADIDLLWQNPSALFWSPTKSGDLRQKYRELDAPLTRSLIALGRWVARQPPVPVDWDWSATWRENVATGALPSYKQLAAGRYAVAVLFPFSIVFLFLAGRKIGGEFTAWISVLLLAGNALVLLHTRRAMAEGPLLFTTTLTLWSFVQFEKRPWLCGIPAGLAFSAKQTLIAFMPSGLLAVLWNTSQSSNRTIARLLSWVFYYLALFIMVIALLHPFLWGNPMGAITASIQARRELAKAQASDRPQQALDSAESRLAGMIASLYFNPPAFSETANYQNETQSGEQVYLANPITHLLRSISGGSVLLILNLFGFVSAVLTSIRAKEHDRQRISLLLFANLAQMVVLFSLIPLPWQRYYLPLVPFSCLWVAFGVDRVCQVFWQVIAAHPITR